MRIGIGLDFGTTNSSIAIARPDRSSEAVSFSSREGKTETYRSVLYFEPKSPASTGPAAIERYLAADEKGRLIQSLKSFLASRLFTSTNVFGRQYTLEDLITIILRDLRTQAEAQAGLMAASPDAPIVVGRPVRYSNANSAEDNEFALSRLKKAIEKAGIGPVIFEYEPVAAAYFYESTLDHDELILIGDFGGGTSDFSLLRVGPSARRDRARDGGILGNEGIALAGDAFDARIVRNLVSPALGRGSQYHSVDKVLPMPTWVYSDLERWHYLSFLKSSDTLQMLHSIEAHSLEPKKIGALLHVVEGDLGFYLHQSVQTTKSALSREESSRFLFEDYSVRVEASVKRTSFERWIKEELQKIRGCVDRLLEGTGVAALDVDRVFLTGGSSLVPAVREIFVQRFGNEKISSGSEFTSVARGLALRALEDC
jgi:hypothetical chaperone protein